MSSEVQENIKVDTIEAAITAVKNGEVIVVVDDQDRENEGDFVCAAECITPEIVNFMATHGRGLICTPLVESRCDELGLELMVGKNTAVHETPFTVSVDLLGKGTTTGISASDRAKTIKALTEDDTRAEDLGRPGHIFPLKAKSGGVLRRTGHTEAAIDFARLAGFKPAGVLVEIMNEDGTMARLPDLRKVADQFNLKLVTIADLIEYRLAKETLIERVLSTPIETRHGTFTLHAFKQRNSEEVHLALQMGEWTEHDVILTRVHPSELVKDLFLGAEHEENRLDRAMKKIAEAGRGLVIYMNQRNKGTDLLDVLKGYEQDNVPRLKMDKRDYGIGAQIIRSLGARKLRLMTSKPSKRAGIDGYGIEIVDTETL